MQKLKNILAFFSIAALTITYGCQKPKDPKPAPAIVAYVGFITNGNTGNFTEGDIIKIILFALGGEGFQQISGTETTFLDSTTNTVSLPGFPITSGFDGMENFTDTILYKVGKRDATLKFELTDKKGVKASYRYIVKIAPLLTNIYTVKLFQNDTLGPFLSSSSSHVYAISQAKNYTDSIDITFGVAANISLPAKPKVLKLISPDYRDNEGLKPFIGGNITYFGTSSLDINAVTPLEMAAIKPANTKSIIIPDSLSVSTYQFINYFGKKGLIRVSDIQKTDTTNVSISVEVRVQK